MRVSKNSLLIWYPKVENLPIPKPETKIILLTDKELKLLYGEELPQSVLKKVGKTIKEYFTLPVFIRTDLASGKHGWKDTCYYDGSKELSTNLHGILTHNLCADIMGLSFSAFIVREFIPMDSRFKAFYGNMPINPERRYFVKDGEVICHHPYWIKEAISHGRDWGLPTNWKEILKEINLEGEKEIKRLSSYARKVSRQIEGYWSVDFCKSKNGIWCLIDMARGEDSWHQKDCLKIRKERDED